MTEQRDEIGEKRRRLPGAAVFLVCLAGGALGAIGLRVLAPSLFTGGGTDEGLQWRNERGEIEIGRPRTRGRLVLAEPSYDFGEILDGAHAKHRFEFKNEGSEPLTLLEIEKPCTCIAIDGLGTYDSRGSETPVESAKERDLLTLQPGQRGYLDLRAFPIGATSARDVRNQRLKLATNGLNHESVYLELKATFLYVVGVEVSRAGSTEFRASKQREVELGVIGRSERASFWIDLIDLEKGSFEITGEILVDGRPWKDGPPYFAITTTDSERIGIMRKRVVLDIGGQKPLGRLQHEILVPTSIHGGHPVRLLVRGVVGGDLYLETLTGQREVLPRIAFGVLQPGEATTLRRTVAYVGTHEDLTLGPVEIVRSEGATTPELEVRLAPAGPRRWTLEAELPHGAQHSFVLDLKIGCEPADALPQTERNFQVQGIVPGRASAPPPAVPADSPRLLPERARVELDTVVHGKLVEVAFVVSNPAPHALAIRRIVPREGPPLRFVRAEREDGTPAPVIPLAPRAHGPEPPPVAVVPAQGKVRLVFALDTAPLPRGTASFLAGAEVESDDPVTPRVTLTVRGKIEFPAGLFATSAEAPELIVPLQEIWLPPIGRTGSLRYEVQLRATRAYDGPIHSTAAPATGPTWPAFLGVATEERTGVGGERYVVLRFAASGDKAPGAFQTRVRIETEIGGGYAFETEVRGEVFDDFTFVRVEALRDRHGPGGEVLFGEFVRPVQEIALNPARAGEKLERLERVRYLGGQEGLVLDPLAHVRWSGAENAEPPALEVELRAPEPPEHPDPRLVVRLPRGADRAWRGEIELRATGSEDVVLRVPFAIQVGAER